MKKLTSYLLERLSENSTWRGIFLFLTGIGIVIEPDKIVAITAVGLSLVGLINVLRQGSPTKSQVAEALESKQDKL